MSTHNIGFGEELMDLLRLIWGSEGKRLEQEYIEIVELAAKKQHKENYLINQLMRQKKHEQNLTKAQKKLEKEEEKRKKIGL